MTVAFVPCRLLALKDGELRQMLSDTIYRHPSTGLLPGLLAPSVSLKSFLTVYFVSRQRLRCVLP